MKRAILLIGMLLAFDVQVKNVSTFVTGNQLRR